MATIHHHHHSHYSSHRRPKRHSLDYSSLPSSSSSFKHPYNPTTISLPSHITFSLSSTTSAAASAAVPSSAYSLDTLERHLTAQNFRQADEETRRLLIVLAGEAAVKRGYVFFSEVQFIPKEELQAIDELWKKFSNGRFGYSIQRRIWLKSNKDFTGFFLKVGWMKKLNTEVEQYNYRSFPNEFMWDLNNNGADEASVDNNNNNNNEQFGINNAGPPEGHLPLTNALRGIQLLNCILTHPAFAEGDDGEEKEGGNGEENDGQVVDEVDKKKSRLASLRDKLFKPNYSF